MPLAEDVNLPHLADITNGFVGADLEALCREAGVMVTAPEDDPPNRLPQANPYEQLLALTVYQRAFLEAMNEVEPSAIR